MNFVVQIGNWKASWSTRHQCIECDDVRTKCLGSLVRKVSVKEGTVSVQNDMPGMLHEKKEFF